MSLPLHITDFKPSDSLPSDIKTYLTYSDSLHFTMIFTLPLFIILIALIFYIIKTKKSSKPGKNHLDIAYIGVILLSILTLFISIRFLMNASQVTGTAHYESAPFTAEKVETVKEAGNKLFGTFVTTDDDVRVFISGQPPIKFKEYVTGSTRGVKDIKVKKGTRYKIINEKRIITKHSPKTVQFNGMSRVPGKHAFYLEKIED